mgnify:CR=1 FL=1
MHIAEGSICNPNARHATRQKEEKRCEACGEMSKDVGFRSGIPTTSNAKAYHPFPNKLNVCLAVIRIFNVSTE